MTLEQSACYIADLAYARGTQRWQRLHDRALGELKRHVRAEALSEMAESDAEMVLKGL